MMFTNALIQRYRFSLRRSKKIFYLLKGTLLRKANKLPESTYNYVRELLMDLVLAISEKKSEKNRNSVSFWSFFRERDESQKMTR